MEKFSNSLKLEGREISDDTSFDLSSKEHTVTIIPRSNSWTFGLAFSKSTDFKSMPQSINSSPDEFGMVRIEASINEPQSRETMGTGTIDFSFFGFTVLYTAKSFNDYSSGGPVELIMNYDSKLKQLYLFVLLAGTPVREMIIFLEDFVYFKPVAWANDGEPAADYNIEILDFESHPELRIMQDNRREQLKTLDLSNCGMQRIPRTIATMTWLEELIIGTFEYWDFPNNARIYTRNKGNQNTIGVIPKELGDLVNLKRLVITGSADNKLEVRDFSVIGKLRNLTYLFIEHTNLRDIAFVSSLVNLKSLSLFDNEISDIAPLSALLGLQYLVLSENPLISAQPVSKLVSLKYLSLIKTRISVLPDLTYLLNLKQLYFSNTSVEDISSVGKLANLEKLSFNYTDVSDIKDLAGLQQLAVLSFQSCRVNYLAPLLNMKGLVQFDCKSNPILDCPADIYETGEPTQLRSYFAAKEIEKSYTAKGDVEMLQTTGVTKLARKKKISDEPDNRRDIKLIILGNSNVGKTNLVNYLETGKFSGIRNTTHGLQVHRWLPDEKRFPSLKDIAVSVWDFGGQEYYHGAYRLFLSDNALYLLLWDKNSNKNGSVKAKLYDDGPEIDLENFEIRYWLDTILHYKGGGTEESQAATKNVTSDTGKKEYKSRLVTVQNKVDDPDTDKQRLDQKLHEKYSISDSFHVSLLQGSNVENRRQYKTLGYFLTQLEDAISDSADKDSIPVRWQQVRNTILQLKAQGRKPNPFSQDIKQNLWISIDDFRKACDSFLTTPLSNDELYTLPRWLDRGGTVVYFPGIVKLKDKIFLRPDVLAERIYEVLNEKVRKAGGEFSANEIFTEKEKEIKNIFLELAQHLELIFEHPIKEKREKGFFLAPQYLPDAHPIEDLFKIASYGAWQAALWIKLPLFYYKKVLHGILLHYAADASCQCRYFWKHGIMFIKNDLRVLIKGLYPEEDQHEGVILIGVEKNAQKQVPMQSEIFNKFRDIIADKERTSTGVQPAAVTTNIQAKGEEKRPAPDVDIQVSYDGKNYVLYKDLLANAGEPKIKAQETGVSLITYNFAAILPTTPQRAKRVFLSYSHQNSKWLARLRTHLAGLRRAKQIETWDDREILPGDLWDDVIKKNLADADIFILLLSADFIASDYIWNEELPRALEQFRQRNATVIPILFEPIDLGGLSIVSESPGTQSYKINDFEIIPKNATGHLQAASLWTNQEEALAKIAEKIREAIKKT